MTLDRIVDREYQKSVLSLEYDGRFIPFDEDNAEYLNEVLRQNMSQLGVSAAMFLRHGPIDPTIFHQEIYESLAKRTGEFWNQYKFEVIPKLKSVYRKIYTGRHERKLFPETEHFRKLSIEEYEENKRKQKKSTYPFRRGFKYETVRERFREMYGKFGGFNIDHITANALYSNSQLKPNNNTRFRIYDDDGIAFGLRAKLIDSLIPKYKRNFVKFSPEELNGAQYLIIKICESPMDYWNKHLYQHIKSQYLEYENLRKMLDGEDIVGFRIVDFNLERCAERQEKALMLLNEDQIGPFNVIPDLVEDYTKEQRIYEGRKLVEIKPPRKDEQRPGGVHFTIAHKNFPIEVQFRDSQDEFYAHYGPRADGIYATQGKKSNDRYK